MTIEHIFYHIKNPEKVKEIYEDELKSIIDSKHSELISEYINENSLRPVITESNLLHLSTLRALCEPEGYVGDFIDNHFEDFMRLFLSGFFLKKRYMQSFQIQTIDRWQGLVRRALLTCYEEQIIDEIKGYLASYLEDRGYKKAS